MRTESAERKYRTGGRLLVYDLGGGTYNVSLVKLGESEHSVEASDGISDLGGDEDRGNSTLAKCLRYESRVYRVRCGTEVWLLNS